jgi:transcriptional regulator with XRE-family HTH domain
MGSASRPKPARLAEKLRQIRNALGLSQADMLRQLGAEDEMFRSNVSAYELGTREPSLPLLLKYARLVGVSTDVLIDDELDLPEKLLPASPGASVKCESNVKAGRGR